MGSILGGGGGDGGLGGMLGGLLDPLGLFKGKDGGGGLLGGGGGLPDPLGLFGGREQQGQPGQAMPQQQISSVTPMGAPPSGASFNPGQMMNPPMNPGAMRR